MSPMKYTTHPKSPLNRILYKLHYLSIKGSRRVNRSGQTIGLNYFDEVDYYKTQNVVSPLRFHKHIQYLDVFNITFSLKKDTFL